MAFFIGTLKLMSSSLRRDIYGLGAPGFPINGVRVPTPDPLAAVRYACVHCVDHLLDSVGMRPKGHLHEDDLQDVHDFLKKNFLYWLEALSLIRSMPEGLIAIRRLEGLLASIGKQWLLTQFVQDAHRFMMCCTGAIERYPLQAYTSALVFSPRGSLVRKQYKAEEPDWIVTNPTVEENWNACLQTLEGHSDSVILVAFSADARLLASVSADRTIRIWDLAAGCCIRTLEGYINSVISVAFSADVRLVASPKDDCTIMIWDSATDICLQILMGHSSLVRSVTFSLDARLLASSSDDRTIRIWDSSTGICLHVLRGMAMGPAWWLSRLMRGYWRRLHTTTRSGSGILPRVPASTHYRVIAIWCARWLSRLIRGYWPQLRAMAQPGSGILLRVSASKY